MIKEETQGNFLQVSSLSDVAFNGVGWKMSSTFIQVVIALVIQIILSRLLSPADFGIVIYAMIFIGFSSQFAEAGIVPALIQRIELNSKHITSGFFISILLGILVWIVIWNISSIITQDPEGIRILKALSFLFIINSLTMVSDAMLQRELSFRKLFWIDNISYFIGSGLVSILLALCGFGAWSLVIGMLVQSIIRGIILYIAHPFRISFRIRIDETKGLLRFGLGMTLARLANYAAGNTSQFVIGNILGATSLGLFQRSNQLISTPITKIVASITAVLFPALSKIQEETDKLKSNYLLLVTVASSLIFPLAVVVSALSREIILLLYGYQWLPAYKSLEILSFNVAFISIFTITDALARAKGLVFAQMRRYFLYAITALLGALVGSKYGIEGAAIGLTCASFVMYLLNAHLAIKITKSSWLDFIKAQRVGFLLSSIIAIFLFLTGKFIIDRFNVTLFWGGFIKIFFSIMVFSLICIILPKSWYGGVHTYIFNFVEKKFSKISNIFRNKKIPND